MVHAQVAQATVSGRVRDVRTGTYLENARVSIRGTNQTTFTNQFGEFRFNNAPAGELTLDVTYTGYYLETASINPSVQEAITVGMRSQSAFQEEEVYDLEAFEVRGEADAMAVAMNEQRNADTTRTVVDSGAFGNVTEGNVGEFVKYLPGISIDYVAADARTIEVRGLGANLTQVTVDGNQMASASSSSANRQFELEQVSMNNVERIEVYKVPTAEMSANTIGGRVNMVSKSAFERDGREIKYSAYLSANSDEFTLSQTPGWGNEEHYKIWPGIDLSYSDVYMEGNLGLIFAYKNNNQFNVQKRSLLQWDYREITQNKADPIPVLRRYTVQDGPKFTNRQTGSVRGDYRLGENTIISSGLQYNYYSSQFRNTNIQWDTGVDERTDITSGTPPSPTFVESKTNSGFINYGGSWRNKHGDTVHGDFSIKHTIGDLELKGGAFYSRATNHYDSAREGMVESATLKYRVPGKITFTNFGDPYGNYDETVTIKVTDAAGNELPALGAASLENFTLDEITAMREADSTDTFKGANFDGRYFMDLGQNRLVLKSGLRYQTQNRDVWAPRTRLYYLKQSQAIGGQFTNEVYTPTAPSFDLPAVAWPDYEKIYQFYQANTVDFSATRGTSTRDNAADAANGTFEVDESIGAAYVMGEYTTLEDRLSIIAGVRYEHTKVEGEGTVREGTTYVPYTDDTTYDDIYPSAALNFDLTDNVIIRLAYAATIGRPNFSDIIPRATVDDIEQEIDVTNPDLNPQTANNYDLTVEYYNPWGGSMTAGVFRKDIEDYIDTETVEATSTNLSQAGLPTDLVGYDLTRRVNRGSAKVQGLELSLMQPFRRVPGMPEYLGGFSVMANATFLKTEGDFGGAFEYNDLIGQVKRSYNFGITYEANPVTVRVKYNHRGRELLARLYTEEEDGYDIYRWYKPFNHVDVDLEYTINRAATIFFSARNIFENPQDRIEDSETVGFDLLAQREQFGVQLTLGVKGRF